MGQIAKVGLKGFRIGFQFWTDFTYDLGNSLVFEKISVRIAAFRKLGALPVPRRLAEFPVIRLVLIRQ